MEPGDEARMQLGLSMIGGRGLASGHRILVGAGGHHAMLPLKKKFRPSKGDSEVFLDTFSSATCHFIYTISCSFLK